MMFTPEFVAAEVEYRTQRITADYRAARHGRKSRLPSLRRLFRLPVRPKPAQQQPRLAITDWQSAG